MKCFFVMFFGAAAVLASLPARAEESPNIGELEAKASSGDAAAMIALGRALFVSANSTDHIPRIVELMRKAAEAGEPEAMDWMGYFHLEGQGVPKDERAALEYFKKAAEAGYAKGQLHYGLLLRQAKTLELDNEKGIEWMQKAAEQGLPEANAALGRLLFSGDRLQKRDPVRSYPYLKAAAEAGDPACQNAMGVICRRGLGTQALYRDPAQAEAWFRKAAEQGYAKAQANLAVQLGLGPKSPGRQEALMWLLAAKKQNEILAIRTYEELEATFTREELEKAHEELTTREVKKLILEAAKEGRSKIEIKE